jgi:hypothetical protein
MLDTSRRAGVSKQVGDRRNVQAPYVGCAEQLRAEVLAIFQPLDRFRVTNEKGARK